MCVGGGAHVPQHLCGGQRTTLWVLGLELRLPDLCSKHFYLSSHLAALFSHYIEILSLTAIRKSTRIVSCKPRYRHFTTNQPVHTTDHNSRLKQEDSWFETSMDYIMILFVFLLRWVLPSSLGWPGTHYVDQACFYSPVLGLNGSVTTWLHSDEEGRFGYGVHACNLQLQCLWLDRKIIVS